jgi:uncharacterized protein
MKIKQLMQEVMKDFPLDVNGVHGPRHWGRVCSHGLRIAELNGADKTVVTLFAFLHDSKRVNEHKDPDHGKRAAEFAKTLNGVYFDITDEQMFLLSFSLRGHSDGKMCTDVTVQTCWDADRLDLWRVYKVPNPNLLSSDAAQFIDLAYNMVEKVDATVRIAL